ncbi:microfibril-associated glycoprotein 4-like [Haliotis cracherodii]|uniref:microfibril-associated glycoprotein 4-like n=1 Tax=Haliotis cracherodii TaxID=6455 RepID=UPI0039EC6BAC
MAGCNQNHHVLHATFIAAVLVARVTCQCGQGSYRPVQLLQDVLARDSNPIWMKTEFLLASCASMCKRHKRCASFFHNSETGSCQAHSWTYRSKDYMNPQAGFKYYVQYTKGTGLRDCSEIQANISSAADDTYTITPPDGQSPILAHCDLTHNGGGWTVIQRRLDGSQNFYRTWNEYKDGFGDLDGEYWLGNENIWRIIKGRQFELQIDLEDFEGEHRYARYQSFIIGNFAEHYALHISVFSGDTGNSMAQHNGQAFSTRDRDLDLDTDGSCAQKYLGGWWYEDCHSSNLNGEYNNTHYGKGINWEKWRGYYYSLQTSVMKVRPVL